MPYPDSPFNVDFNTLLLTNVTGDATNPSIQIEVGKTLNWLCTTPRCTSYRVNTAKCDIKRFQAILEKEFTDRKLQLKVRSYQELPDTVVILHDNLAKTLPTYQREVIVDVHCAAAVLRGANIFAPGVMGLVNGAQLDETVSIYADLKNKCKKGLSKVFQGEKIFIGNGIVKLTRDDLFCENSTQNGIAIRVIETLSGCPSVFSEDPFPRGFALLQNLPSIICVHNLNPRPNEVVLDMCASPGNKTTHISQLMENEGTLIAIDKTFNKVERLKERCAEFSSFNVKSFIADSTKIFSDFEANLHVENGPPFSKEIFDRVLLDAPCSALGKRPQFHNAISEKVVKSYVPLQRKLFTTAVKLLKPSGTLVYSTCTITAAENEGIAAWALKTFPCLELTEPNVHLGAPGWPEVGLTEEYRNFVQRFGPNDSIDSVGFFIACFKKRSTFFE